MTIRADSRYADGETLVVKLPSDGTGQMLWQAAVNLTDISYQFYMVIEGDRLDVIASRAYGDSTKWWVIADMNSEVLWPGALTSGTLLRIPLVNTG